MKEVLSNENRQLCDQLNESGERIAFLSTQFTENHDAMDKNANLIQQLGQDVKTHMATIAVLRKEKKQIMSTNQSLQRKLETRNSEYEHLQSDLSGLGLIQEQLQRENDELRNHVYQQQQELQALTDREGLNVPNPGTQGQGQLSEDDDDQKTSEFEQPQGHYKTNTMRAQWNDTSSNSSMRSLRSIGGSRRNLYRLFNTDSMRSDMSTLRADVSNSANNSTRSGLFPRMVHTPSYKMISGDNSLTPSISLSARYATMRKNPAYRNSGQMLLSAIGQGAPSMAPSETYEGSTQVCMCFW